MSTLTLKELLPDPHLPLLQSSSCRVVRPSRPGWNAGRRRLGITQLLPQGWNVRRLQFANCIQPKWQWQGSREVAIKGFLRCPKTQYLTRLSRYAACMHAPIYYYSININTMVHFKYHGTDIYTVASI